MPPPYPPAVACLWERLIAPIIVLAIATLPWNMLLAGYLAAWFFDRFLAEDLARRHEPRDHDSDQRTFLCDQIAPATRQSGTARPLSTTDMPDSECVSDKEEENDLQSAVPAS